MGAEEVAAPVEVAEQRRRVAEETGYTEIKVTVTGFESKAQRDTFEEEAAKILKPASETFVECPADQTASKSILCVYKKEETEAVEALQALNEQKALTSGRFTTTEDAEAAK